MCTHSVPEPPPSSSLLTGPSIPRPPRPPRTPRRPQQPSPPPPTPQPPPPQPPNPPPPPRPCPANHPESRGESLPNGPPKPVPTASNAAASKAQAPAKPPPAARPEPKTAAKQPPKPIGAPGPQPAAKPKPKPKPGGTTTARAQPPEDVLYDLWPQPSQTRQQQRPARNPQTVTNAAATTFMAESATPEAQPASSRHPSKRAPQAHGPPPTKSEQHQGPPAAPPPPYQPSLSGHIQQMPHYCRHRQSQPNPEADTVRAYPRVPKYPRGTELRGLPRACHLNQLP